MWQQHQHHTTIHEGGLHADFCRESCYTTTAEELRQAFEVYGTVDRTNIVQDRETGRSRGFGFVDMPNAMEANAAMVNLNGTALGGRTLTVNEARASEERDGPRRPRW
jgi:RNA recognition motif-containing protein